MNNCNEYVESLIEINKNLRSQLELLYKLLRTKLKFEENRKIEKFLDELEILKTTMSFNIQKNSNIVSKYFLKRKHSRKPLIEFRIRKFDKP